LMPDDFDMVTERSNPERQVRSAGVRPDPTGNHCGHPGGQVAVPGKQYARQPVVSAVAARSRSPGQQEERTRHLQRKKLQKELADISKETRKLKTRLTALERRRDELMKELNG
jgi:hypothetical protein